LKHDVALERYQTDTGGTIFNDWIVLHRCVSLIEVARSKASKVMTEGAFQHTGPFDAGMAMAGELRSAFGAQHENANIISSRYRNRPPRYAAADPAPLAYLVLSQGCGQVGLVPNTFCLFTRSINPPEREFQGTGGHDLGRRGIQQDATHLLEPISYSTTLRAKCQVSGDDKASRLVKRSCRMFGKSDVTGVV